MNCNEVRPLLPEMNTGDLAPAVAGALHKHLEGCPSCRAEQQALNQVLQALEVVPPVEVAIDFRRLYLRAADQEWRRARRWRRLCLTAAAAAVLLFLLWGVGLQVRLDREQVVLRWGQEPPGARLLERPRQEPPPGPGSRKPPAPVSSAHVAELKLIRELVHALAAEVERLDGKQEKELQQLREELARLAALSENRWTTAEFQFTTLLNAQIGPRKENENP